MRRRVTIFAVAITVLLLIALTMNSVSAESKAKVKLGPSDTAKEKLNHSDAAKVNLNHTDAAKVALKPSDVDKRKLNHTDAAKVTLNPRDTDEENLNYTDAAKVALNPSESMTFPTERALNELIYDDGTAEDAYAWSSADNGFAVRFTPLSYPVDILTARICFWPDWPDSDHEEFAVYVYDDNGPGGEPGTCLGGPIYYTAIDWGWCEVDISGLGITIVSGDFYILYKQLTDDPDCEGLCRDKSLPQYGRSWDYFDGGWDLYDEENYMIRCVVDVDETTDEWTYMVYLDGDNNLEGAGIDDFMEMSSVGSTSAVNIVVQFDRIPGHSNAYGDWTTTKRFLVAPGMTPTPANALTDLGECNMGDPNTLDDFVTWAMATYPANNYAVILWNHGSGCKEKGWVPWADDTGIARGVCEDWTNGTILSLQDLEQALSGNYVDLLGYDACYMHMVEVVYQVMDNAGVSVGSEARILWDGWPYDTILGDLTGTPTMNEYTLGEVIVQRYIEFYGTAGYDTLSAVDVDNGDIPGLVTAVDDLAQVLLTKIPGNYDEIQQARNEVEVFDPQRTFIDLYHFAELIGSYVPDTSTEAQAVMDNINNAVYAEAHGSGYPNAHGLSIYFPETGAAYLTSYEDIKFAVDTEWDEFLKKYYNPPTPPPGEDIGVFRNGKWILLTSGSVIYNFWWGLSTDTPVTGDWNGDGEDTIGVYRNGEWTLSNSITTPSRDHNVRWGLHTDIPVTGDWDGYGTDTIGLYRDGEWILSDSITTPSRDYNFWWGRAFDKPVTGDWNDDGTDTIGLYRNGEWILSNSITTPSRDHNFWWGRATDIPVTGDWNDDGTDTIGLYRGGEWILSDSITTPSRDYNFWWGLSTDTPVTGHWS